MVRLLSKFLGRSSPSKGDSLPRPSSAESSDPSTSSVGYVGERNVGGARHGWGRFAFASGDSYEGEWNDNMKWGFGDAHYCSGSRYRGAWRADMKHGQGIFVFGHDGSSYTGDWLDDKKTGNGVAVFRTGNRYAGQWLLDAMHGKGRFVYASGDAYEGDWVRNRKTGFGTWTSSDATCTYAGAWQDDLRHGAGVLVGADGTVYEVEYRNGDLVSKILPKRTLPAPPAVDCSIPEPPAIVADPRATSSPLRVPRARTRQSSQCTSPQSESPESLANSGNPSVYGNSPGIPLGRMDATEDADEDLHGLRRNNATVSQPPAPTETTTGAGEEALLARLRAWRTTAPAPPVPQPPQLPNLPTELVGRVHEPAPNSSWGARSNSSEHGDVTTVDAKTVCRHADLSLVDCEDTFEAPVGKTHMDGRGSRSQSVLSGGSGQLILDDVDDMV